MTPYPPILVDLAFQYRSDKAVTPFAPDQYVHGYAAFYDEVFASRRDDKVALLDVGAWGENQGGSALMWHSYFTRGHIYALDYWDHILTLNHIPRITAFQANLDEEAPMVNRVRAALGGTPLDIVIEDAGHNPRQQVRTLINLLPFLAPSFQYVIEDVGAGGRTDLLDALRDGKPFPFCSPEEWSGLLARIGEVRLVRPRPSSALLYFASSPSPL